MNRNFLSGKHCLITGATNGIGKAAAVELAAGGVCLYLHGRSPEKLEAVKNEIVDKTGNQQVETIIGDFSSMQDVKQAAEAFLARKNRLDILINNAGGYFAERVETVDGFELSFALNHLAYFFLTKLLMPALKQSESARIINVSSGAHAGVRINFEDLQNHVGYTSYMAYGQSKLMNLLFTYELHRRLQGRSITVNAVHPGFVASGFGSSNKGFMRWLLEGLKLFALSPAKGAETIVYLASSPEVEGVSGKYFFKKKPVKSSPVSYDQADAKRLWEISEKMVEPWC